MSNHYQRIWKVAGLIPQGCVASYGQIADLAGLPGRARMVSMALKKAPDELELPWHRILSSSGKISIPAGSEARQEQINRLQEEDVVVLSGRVSMKQYRWQPDLVDLLFQLDY